MNGVEPLLQRGNRPRRMLEFRLRWYWLFNRRSNLHLGHRSRLGDWDRRRSRRWRRRGNVCRRSRGSWFWRWRGNLCRRSHGRRYCRPGGKLQQLALHLIERETVGRDGGLLRLDLPGELRDGLLEIGIVARQRERGAVLRERFLQFATAMMDFPETADRGEVFGSVLEDVFELALR